MNAMRCLIKFILLDGIQEHGHIKQSAYDTLRATVRLNEWLYTKARPHLGPVYIDYPVPSNVRAAYEYQQPIE
ncbi:MAG: hypothetical protein EZS28_030767 [Streblomastix strix]|uniref:Uncharacterized protein n=1 Tax=Streblomastix strix TaxID=222440 RepID=A0A5J4UTX5_9EUKA|nr:MAG: hypothetical protein EZS28_030767 [Streblomastix strix]